MSNLSVFKDNIEVKLQQKDYLASGGEGSIYVKNNLVYKIYTDITKCIPEGKVLELNILKRNNILFPQYIIKNKAGANIGFVMNFVDNTVPLMKVFANSYRTKVGFTEKDNIKLVENMIENIHHIHSNKIIIVDGNEFNYLLDTKTHSIPYFIDVDSYQTKSYPATAIMASIRDNHTKGFNELSDWFSFAVVATQIFVGIHPFKGNHPKFKQNDFEARMKANISIFSKDILLPPSVRPFDSIPDNYREWFINIFDKGKRTPPPDGASSLKTKTKKTIKIGSKYLDLQLIKEYDSEITGFEYINSQMIVYTKDKIYIGDNIQINNKSKNVSVYYDSNFSDFFLLETQNGYLNFEKLRNNNDIKYLNKISSTGCFVTDNIITDIFDDKLSNIKVNKITNTFVPEQLNNIQIMKNSSKRYRGVVLSDVLGKLYAYMPFRDEKGNICLRTIQIPELTKCKIVDSKFDNNVLTILIFKDNKYKMVYIIFEGNKYNYFEFDNVSDYFVNSITLENGINVTLNSDDELILFHKKAPEKNMKIIKDSGLPGNSVLVSFYSSVYFYYENKLFSLKTK